MPDDSFFPLMKKYFFAMSSKEKTYEIINVKYYSNNRLCSKFA